jgi:hypothetical protein
LSPNVSKIIDRFNKFTFWMIEEILSYDKKRMRAGAIEKFLQIAEECRVLNNLNDCMNIVTSINNYIVKHMDKTWKVMSKNALDLFSKLEEFCSYERNYFKLRSQQNAVKNKPCVPYLGLLLKDLAYIEEGPKYINDKDMVNYDKVNRVGCMINEFLSYNTQAYLFRHIPQLVMLSDLQPKNEEELEELASQLEPVFSLSKTKISKKRISTTDSKFYHLTPSFIHTESKTEISFMEDHY